MTNVLSQRLLPALQLTRMALVFTAIADSSTALLLWGQDQVQRGAGESILTVLDWRQWVATVIVSVGLYGFGMSLNDIIDRRKDRQLAPSRPLASGKVSIHTAYLICALLALMALAAGLYLASTPAGWMAFMLVVWTVMLILFYDLVGKYLVAPGLLTLGLIRFFHATIPAPSLPLLWHPLLLLNHVAILSAVAYHLEDKRPTLTRGHWAGVVGGLLLLNALAVGLLAWRRGAEGLVQSLWVQWGLAWPALAAGIFLLLAWVIYRRATGPREAGARIMLAGLLWLIVYDAAFVTGYLGWRWGLAILALGPLAYAAVRIMRWWGRGQGSRFRIREHERSE